MKTKTKQLTYDEVMALPREPRQKPRKPGMLFRTLMRVLGTPDLMATHFTYTTERMEEAGKGPWLVLMNHSAFIDLEIASRILYPMPYCIVCTSDGFVGKDGLMRSLGCIPTEKFVSDVSLIRDMIYAVKKLNVSVLMYPEASYSFDGTATPLPEGIGALAKKLGVPVVMIKTEGAFARDPLYNCLQKRKVKVSAVLKCLVTAEELEKKSAGEVDALLKEAFTFDNFRWQQENNIRIAEPFRADGLNRVLYKCPCCNAEGFMEGRGTSLSCTSCGAQWELTELGQLEAVSGEGKFTHVPDWYAWERKCVRKEIEEGTYRLDIPVKISMLVDTKCLYNVGEGRLVHDCTGFHLTGCDGKLDYRHAPLSSYSLYSDYFWYELGDMICIGDRKALYYCFPQCKGDVVVKTRLAAEELYKIKAGS